MIGKKVGNRFSTHISLSAEAMKKLERLMQIEHLNISNSVERAIHFKYDKIVGVDKK